MPIEAFLLDFLATDIALNTRIVAVNVVYVHSNETSQIDFVTQITSGPSLIPWKVLAINGRDKLQVRSPTQLLTLHGVMICTPVLYILLIFNLRIRCCGAVLMLVLSSNIIIIGSLV